MKQLLILPFLFLSLFTTATHAEIIGSIDRTTWSPGIPGGIPEDSGIVVNLLDYGADAQGVDDSAAALTAAINDLPAEGGTVLLPKGIYRLASKVSLSKDNVVIRGEGASKTKIMCDHTETCFEVITYRRGDWQGLVSGFDKGSTTITVADGNRFTAGQFAEIEQDNDPAIMYTNPEWNQSWSENSVGQMFKVVAINGNQLTVDNPIHYQIRTDLAPRIRPQGLVTNVGFERFYIEKLQAGNSIFFFKNAAYCWIRSIESNHTRVSHVASEATLGCEFRDSYFHHSFSYGGGGSGYGVSLGLHVTDALCENNVFNHLRHAMIIQLGATGCVFGYNFSLNPVQGDGEENLNQGWVPPDLSLHGHYAQMNLFEGNMVQEIGIADYWGPMGPGNTFLRNDVSGEGIFLYDYSHHQNLVGNVSSGLSSDGSSQSTLIHGNSIGGSLQWDSGISDHTIPASYYHQSRPSFFDDTLWPVIWNNPSSQIPAAKRWFAGKPVYDPLSGKHSILRLYMMIQRPKKE